MQVHVTIVYYINQYLRNGGNMSHVFNVRIKWYNMPVILTEKEFNLLYDIPRVKTGYFR